MTGKVALVTGSSKGIGKRIAADLLQQGHFVLLNYAFCDADAEAAAAELSGISADFRIIKADLSCAEGVERLVEELGRLTGALDYLVLNAGATARAGFGEITREQWDTVFNVNLAIPFFLCQRLYPLMRDEGRIVFVGSVLGRVPHAVSIPYGVSKAALATLAQYLAPQVAAKRITVNVVAPGFTETGWHAGKDAAQRARIEAKIPLGRFADPAEISRACLQLIENGYITGQILYVDGGYGLT